MASQVDPKSLLRHWPNSENVLNVIGSQAETFTDPLLLAVHQPMRFTEVDTRSNKMVGEIGGTTQETVLDRVLEDHPDGYRVVPVIGPPGVGKSHACRWISAKIEELNQEGSKPKYHVVRVQKGASLSKVLDLVAQGLKGNAYKKFQDRMRNASQGLPLDTLLYALMGELSKRFETDEGIVPDWVTALELDEPYEVWKNGLAAFLHERELRRKFFDNDGKGPLALLARRIHEGLKPEEIAREEDVRTKFFSKDFGDAQKSVRGNAFERLSQPTQDFLSQIRQEPGAQQECADLLNGALDPATYELLKFRGGELNDLFNDVRRELYKENREWVLILEDLTALSGIRTSLFDLIIRGRDDLDEATGKLCTIRSVIAATEGHISGFKGPWETIASRAEKKYEMRQRDADTDQRARVIDLVGAYLNAARVGRDDMSAAYEEGSGKDWIPNFSDDEEDPNVSRILDAFNKSSQGYHLFPLNKHAIERRLELEHLTGDEKKELIYNPREIVGRLVRDTLGLRDVFKSGGFPSKAFGEDRIQSARFSTDLARRVDRERDLSRYSRLLAYWGNQPEKDGEAARLSKEVYDAFQIDWIDFGEPEKEKKKEKKKEKEKEKKKEEEKDSAGAQQSAWVEIIRGWRSGNKLKQDQARKIRKAVANAVLNNGVPEGWPGLTYPTDKNKKLIADKKVFIPRSGTGQIRKEVAAIVVCTEKDLEDERRGPVLALELLSVLHVQEEKKDRWSQDGWPEGASFRRYCAFVRRHQEHLAKWLRESDDDIRIRGGEGIGKILPQKKSSIPVLESLLLSSALLGSGEDDQSPVPDRIANLVRDHEQNVEGEGDWADLQDTASKFYRNAREAFQRSFCAYQGLGHTPLALDISDLYDHIRSITVGKISAPRSGTPFGPDIKKLRRDYSSLHRDREKHLKEFREQAEDYLDGAYTDELKELLDQAKAAGFHNDDHGNSLVDPITRNLKTIPVDLDQTIKLLAGLQDSKDARRIVLLSSVTEESLDSVKRLTSAIALFLVQVEPRVQLRLEDLRTADDSAALGDLRATVEQIAQVLGA